MMFSIKKPTFKDMFRKVEQSRKNRIETAKECLFKLIDSMNDKMNMALTTFNTRHKL